MFATFPYKRMIMVAGASLALATFSFADVLTDASGCRYHTLSASGTIPAAELTFLATDSTNAVLYRGDLVVPQWVQDDASAQDYQVRGLSEYACIYCNELTSVTLPEGLTSIGYAALSGCSNLRWMQLPSTLVTLADWACYGDASLQMVTLPEATRRVGACAFAFCTELDSLVLGAKTRAVGAQAFYYCSELTEVYLPWTVTQIGVYAFAYCSALRRITVEGRPVAITPDVFEGVDVSRCTLVVPTDQLEAYQTADVWCDFDIVDGGYLDLEQPEAELEAPLMRYWLEGHVLCVEVLGDAPALLYDVRGERLGVALPKVADRLGQSEQGYDVRGLGERPVRSELGSLGGSRFSLSAGTYLLRCGKECFKIMIE